MSDESKKDHEASGFKGGRISTDTIAVGLHTGTAIPKSAMDKIQAQFEAALDRKIGEVLVDGDRPTPPTIKLWDPRNELQEWEWSIVKDRLRKSIYEASASFGDLFTSFKDIK